MMLGGLTAGGVGMMFLGMMKRLKDEASLLLRCWGGRFAAAGVVAQAAVGCWAVMAQPPDVRTALGQGAVYMACLVVWVASAEAIESVRNYVGYGASPRAAIAMAEAARACALISGRPTAGFEDVKAVAPAVLNHRIILNYKGRFDKVDSLTLIGELLDTLDEAELNLPADMHLAKGSDE